MTSFYVGLGKTAAKDCLRGETAHELGAETMVAIRTDEPLFLVHFDVAQVRRTLVHADDVDRELVAIVRDQVARSGVCSVPKLRLKLEIMRARGAATCTVWADAREHPPVDVPLLQSLVASSPLEGHVLAAAWFCCWEADAEPMMHSFVLDSAADWSMACPAEAVRALSAPWACSLPSSLRFDLSPGRALEVHRAALAAAWAICGPRGP